MAHGQQRLRVNSNREEFYLPVLSKTIEMPFLLRFYEFFEQVRRAQLILIFAAQRSLGLRVAADSVYSDRAAACHRLQDSRVPVPVKIFRGVQYTLGVRDHPELRAWQVGIPDQGLLHTLVAAGYGGPQRKARQPKKARVFRGCDHVVLASRAYCREVAQRYARPKQCGQRSVKPCWVSAVDGDAVRLGDDTSPVALYRTIEDYRPESPGDGCLAELRLPSE